MSDGRKRHRSAPETSGKNGRLNNNNSLEYPESSNTSLHASFSDERIDEEEPMSLDDDDDEGRASGNFGSMEDGVQSSNQDEEEEEESDTDDTGIVANGNSSSNSSNGPSSKLTSPLQIFYVDIPLLDKKLEEENIFNPTNLERIKFMVDKYNEKYTKKTDKATYTPKSLKANTFDPAKTPYTLTMYTKLDSHLDDEVEETYFSLSKIRFLHRDLEADEQKNGMEIGDLSIQANGGENKGKKSEIFILPSDTGFQLGKKWALSQFPGSIASKILAEKSTDEKTLKNLFGNRHFAKYRMKRKEALGQREGIQLHFSPQICTGFRAVVEHREVKTLLGHLEEDDELKLDVSTFSISFKCQFKKGRMDKYAQLCRLLSQIHLDDTLKRSKEYQNELTLVSSEIAKRLDGLLLGELEKILKISLFQSLGEILKHNNKLHDFIVCHPNCEDYFDADQYHLTRGRNKLVKKFNSFPSLEQILMAIKQMPWTGRGLRPKYSKLLQMLKISFSLKNKMESGKNLISCLEGIFFDEEEDRNFWRVGRNWYEISKTYVFMVHREFSSFLKENFLPSQAHRLNVPWPLKDEPVEPKKSACRDDKKPEKNDDEKSDDSNDKKSDDSNNKKLQQEIYNLMLTRYKQERKKWEENPLLAENTYLETFYSKMKNMLICDNKMMLHDVEICDLLEYRPENRGTRESTIFVYHVKKYFKAGETRDVAGQLLNSASKIQSSFSMGAKNPALKRLFDWARDPSKPHNFVKDFENYGQFRNEFRHATFVQAVAHGTDNTLVTDRDLKWTFKWSEFREAVMDMLSTLKKSVKIEEQKKLLADVETGVTDWLRENGFFDDEQSFTAKWYEYCGTTKTTKINDKIKPNFHLRRETQKIINNDKIFQLLKTEYYTKFTALPPKQQILTTAEALQSLGFEFKICEIPTELFDMHNKLD